MKLSEKISLWKQRRILRKMQRCIDKILKYEATIDGSFLSPAQLVALRDFYRYCKGFKTKIKVIRPYTSAELGFLFSPSHLFIENTYFTDKEYQEALRELHKVCTHSADTDIKPFFFKVHLGVFADEQRFEGFSRVKSEERKAEDKLYKSVKEIEGCLNFICEVLTELPQGQAVVDRHPEIWKEEGEDER